MPFVTGVYASITNTFTLYPLLPTIYGTAGDDSISGTAAAEAIYAGDGWDRISGKDGDDVLYGEGGLDDLFGDAGNDQLYGGEGWDQLYGGAGADYLYGGEGHDRCEGGDGADHCQGDAGNDSLSGDQGADTLYGGDDGDYLTGGEGADYLDGGAGTDSASYHNSFAGVNIDLSTNAAHGGEAEGDVLVSIENLTGSKYNDILTGNAEANYLSGDDGDDVLSGGAGMDGLYGGIGKDTLYGGDDSDTLWGDAADDRLFGGDGDDFMAGGHGADLLTGGLGIDTLSYASSSTGVTTGVTINLATNTASGGDAHLDTISEFENVTGSRFADTLTGTSGTNVIAAGAGDDMITGGTGADTFVFRVENYIAYEGYKVTTGHDTITDFVLGEDHLKFDNLDTLWNLSFAQVGADTVITYANGGGTLTLCGVNSDALIQNHIDAISINGTGNTLTLTNTIVGTDGNNILNGAAGVVSLQGLGGNDSYFVDSAGDTIVETTGVDNVNASVSYTLAAGVAVETLRTTNAAGTAAINLTGNNLANIVIGNAGANNLNGGGGPDTMQGLAGNDTYVVDNVSDKAIEAASAGTDQVNSAVSFTLGANVENLTLTGTAAINGTGNTLNNVIIGNAANNILSGSSGIDALNGGTGNDILIGGAGKDAMTGAAGADDFDFNSIAEIGNGATRDIIRDFVHLTDDIDLSTIDANGASYRQYRLQLPGRT